jgi:hypothetical protein
LLTPNEIAKRDSIQLAESGKQSPKITTPEEDALALFGLIRDLVPLKVAALELCNCAFVSGFVEKKANGSFDDKSTLEACIKYSSPDFSALGQAAPQLTPSHVRWNMNQGQVSVRYFGNNQPSVPGFEAVASNIDRPKNGGIPTCKIVKAPTALKALSDAQFRQLYGIYMSLPAVDQELLMKAINKASELTIREAVELKRLSQKLLEWIDQQFKAAQKKV